MKRKIKCSGGTKALLLTLGICGVLVSVPVSRYIKTIQTEEQQQASIYERTAPNYSSMEALQSAQDKSTVTEGTISLEQFMSVSQDNSLEFLDYLRPILSDGVYTQLLTGIGTDYYAKAIDYNYQDLSVKIDDMLVEAGLINALYNKYKLSFDEMLDFDGCAGGEACEMLKFINKYTSGELKDFLMTAHEHWESLVYYEMNQQEIDDSYLKLFYQDEICANYDYIQNYDVSFVVLNSEQLEKPFDELQKAYDIGLIPVTTISNYGDNSKAVPSKRALEKIDLYKDLDFYDGTFATLASNTIQTLFADDVINNTEYLGGAELATSSNALKDKLKSITNNTDNQTDKTERDYSKLENWNVQQYSLADRNDNDVLYILWKINRIEHTDKIPAMESIKDKLEMKAKVYQAQKKLSATIYAEKAGMTDEEVSEYIEQIYNGHTKE